MVDKSSKNGDYDKLFKFWEEIPVVETLPNDVFLEIDSHEYRTSIVEVLRKGVFDPEFDRYRHALTMKEIMAEVKQSLCKDRLPKSTLYHHRDVLLDLGIIQEVVTILENRRYTTYYGRTARAFIGDQLSSVKTKEQHKKFLKVLEALNPDEDRKNLDKLINDLDALSLKKHERIVVWLEDHVDLIYQHDLDAIFLYALLDTVMGFGVGDTDLTPIIWDYLNL